MPGDNMDDWAATAAGKTQIHADKVAPSWKEAQRRRIRNMDHEVIGKLALVIAIICFTVFLSLF